MEELNNSLDVELSRKLEGIFPSREFPSWIENLSQPIIIGKYENQIYILDGFSRFRNAMRFHKHIVFDENAFRECSTEKELFDLRISLNFNNNSQMSKFNMFLAVLKVVDYNELKQQHKGGRGNKTEKEFFKILYDYWKDIVTVSGLKVSQMSQKDFRFGIRFYDKIEAYKKQNNEEQANEILVILNLEENASRALHGMYQQMYPPTPRTPSTPKIPVSTPTTPDEIVSLEQFSPAKHFKHLQQGDPRINAYFCGATGSGK